MSHVVRRPLRPVELLVPVAVPVLLVAFLVTQGRPISGAGPAILIMAIIVAIGWRRLRRSVVLSAKGVSLGATGLTRRDDLTVPWTSVAALTLTPSADGGTDVEVRLREGERIPLAHHGRSGALVRHLPSGRLDARALRTAVASFAPDVPVVSG